MIISGTDLPDVGTLVQAARKIVFDARERDNLDSLTVKSVRKQVERDFSLNEGALDIGDIKIALRNAVNTAVSEDTAAAVSTTKRKRSPEGSNEPEEVKPKKIAISGGKRGKGKPGSDEEEESGAGRKKRKVRVTKSKKIIESDPEEVEGPTPPSKRASTSKPKQVPAVPSKPSLVEQNSRVAASAEASESELSVLIDEPRKKKRAKGKTKEAPKAAKGRKAKEPTKALDKDEETIKRLKLYVSGCGVRKPWAKEFANLPLPEQQISRLKEILADLGMTGKYTMEKAKEIKDRRALARELSDVLEYERKAGASRGSRNRSQTKTKRPIGELDTDSDAQESSEYEEEDEPDSPTVKRKKNTASRSIMAYLANQSSDGE